MAFSTCIQSGINFIHKLGAASNIFPSLIQVQHYAARKGTRAKAMKKKIKNVAAKLSYKQKVDLKRKSKSASKAVKPEQLCYFGHNKPLPIDDVYYRPYYKWITYSFADAISQYREYFDPTMFDKVDSDVNIFVELNMKGVKKNRPVNTFQKLVAPMHNYEFSEPRKILVFCEPDEIQKLTDAGATVAGGKEIIKRITSGEIDISEYTTILAKATLMADILTIRGILKRRLPSTKSNTLGIDLLPLLDKHLNGIYYTVQPYPEYPEYGHSTICIGKLNMDTHKLEENMQCIIDSIMSAKPKRPGDFITRIRTQCPNSKEKFLIDHKLYIQQEKSDEKKDAEEDEDIEDEDDRVATSV